MRGKLLRKTGGLSKKIQPNLISVGLCLYFKPRKNYRPHGSHGNTPAMRSSDQKTASQLLKLKETGYNPWRLAVISRRQVLRLLFVLVFASLAQTNDLSSLFLTTFTFCGGIIIGAMINEIAFIFRVSKVWPFTEKTTDWEKVRQLAKG